MAASREAEVANVQAPSGLTGFLLVMRLPGLRSYNRQDAQGRWIVRVPVSGAAAVRTLLEKVQLWLRQERIAETTVSVGNEVYRVRVDGAELQDTTSGGDSLQRISLVQGDRGTGRAGGQPALLAATVESTKNGSGLRQAPSLRVHQH